MRKITFSAMLGLMLFSCTKSDVNEIVAPSSVNQSQTGREGCTPTEMTVNLMAGQTMLAGNVNVTNDGENVTVTYTTDPGWFLSQIHLYVGEYEFAPQNNGGNPQPGKFPIKESFNPWVSTWSTSIPLSSLPDCFIVAAHSVVHNTTGNGGTQTGWGQGSQFPGNNWGMYFNYCIESCE